MIRAERRSAFGEWHDSLKEWEKLLVQDIIISEGGYSYEMFRKYILGDTDIAKNLPPAVKTILIQKFPRAEKHLYSPTEELIEQ
jgi:hypothetical protein